MQSEEISDYDLKAPLTYTSAANESCTIKLSIKSKYSKNLKIQNTTIRFPISMTSTFLISGLTTSEVDTTHVFASNRASQKAVTDRNQQSRMFYLTARNSGYSSVQIQEVTLVTDEVS